MKLKYRLLFFLIGVAGMIVMFVSLDAENIPWDDLFRAETLLLFLGLFALWLIIYSLHTISYFVILGKEGKKIKFHSMLKICMSGFALNSVTPAGLVGGEPYRIMEMKRHCSTEKAVSSTLTFSLFYVMGHVVAWLASIVIYVVMGCPSEAYITVIMVISGVTCVGALTFFFLSKRKGFLFPMVRLVGKLPFCKKPIAKLVEKKSSQFAEIDDNIRAFRTKRARFWLVLSIQFITRVLEATEYFILLYYFGQRVNPFHAMLIFGTASLIANLIFIIPMQAGSREGGLFIALSFLSIPESIGSAVNIVYRVRDLLSIFFGVMLVIFVKKSKKEKEMILKETLKIENLSLKRNKQKEEAKKDTISQEVEEPDKKEVVEGEKVKAEEPQQEEINI